MPKQGSLCGLTRDIFVALNRYAAFSACCVGVRVCACATGLGEKHELQKPGDR